MFFNMMQVHGHGQRIGNEEFEEQVMIVIVVVSVFSFVFFLILPLCYRCMVITLTMSYM